MNTLISVSSGEINFHLLLRPTLTIDRTELHHWCWLEFCDVLLTNVAIYASLCKYKLNQHLGCVSDRMGYTILYNKVHLDAHNFYDAKSKRAYFRYRTRPEERQLLLTLQVTHANFISVVQNRDLSGTTPQSCNYCCCIRQQKHIQHTTTAIFLLLLNAAS